MIYSLILLSCFFVGIPNASINSSFLRLNQLTCEIPSMLSSNFPSVFCLREQTALSVLKCRLNSREYSSPLMETSLNVHSFLMTTSPKCRVSRRAIWDNLYYLILYTVFFVIGYKLDFMTTKRMPDMQWMSGYVLMAFWAGYVFINKVLPWKMTAGTTGQCNFYYVFKFLLYLIGGFFTAPFVVLWTVYKFIRALRR